MNISIRYLANTPIPAAILGGAGLIPFFVLAGLIEFFPEFDSQTTPLLLGYGAVILSFLGGTRWGFAAIGGNRDDWSNYIASITPAFIAWFALILPDRAAFFILTGAFGLWFIYEITTPPPVMVPVWYNSLRAALTALVVLCLAIVAISS